MHALIALLSQEIKELAEKRRHLDNGQGVLTLSVAAPYVTRVAAELTFDYKDRYLLQSVPLAHCGWFVQVQVCLTTWRLHSTRCRLHSTLFLQTPTQTADFCTDGHAISGSKRTEASGYRCSCYNT